MLVGNGGGYGYGVMGARTTRWRTTALAVPASTCAPTCRRSTPTSRRWSIDLSTFRHPAYLRLGAASCRTDSTLPPYAAWRQLTDGPAGRRSLVVGPLAGSLWTRARGTSRGAAADPLGR